VTTESRMFMGQGLELLESSSLALQATPGARAWDIRENRADGAHHFHGVAAHP
jgi:hypothetical protein